MKKIHHLHFKLLPFVAHFDFFSKFYVMLDEAGTALKQAIATLFKELLDWLKKEETLAYWVRRSALTAQIADADHDVDRALVAVNAGVNAALHAADAATVAAANRIHIMLRNYGSEITRKSYDEEAGAVRAILDQFNTTYAADVPVAGITPRVQELYGAFNRFETLLGQREAEQGQKPDYTFREVRKGIEGVYDKIGYVIEGTCAVGPAPDFTAFVNILNPYIDRLNIEFAKTRHDISDCEPEGIPDQYYTGQALTPTPHVLYVTPTGTIVLELGKHYDLSYRDNVEVGNAKCIILGKGDYKGGKTVTFIIKHR
ncbi:MAG: DUF6261 family protein [Prevotellaceae bacterium]|jgi:hypothetical protein|nr:DUF6261 family protein [Prevotellaceae bacterium]